MGANGRGLEQNAIAATTQAPATDLVDEKQRWVEMRIPGADTRVVLFTPDGWEDRIGGFTNITFVADDVQRTYDELAAKGVEFSMPPKTEHWGTAAIFKDADGNQFVLSSRTK